MNTLSLRQPATLSLASMLVAAAAVAISVVAITTDDVVVPDRIAPLNAPTAALVRSDTHELCRPAAPNVGLC